MNTKKITFSLLFIAFILVACSSRKSVNPISTDLEYTNQQIKLRVFDFNNSYKNSDPIFAEIWNYSEKFIRFPNNYNIRIFEKTKNGWEEIAEKPVTRLPSGDFIFNPLDGSSWIQMVFINPDLPDLNRNYDLRIYVFGQMEENNQQQEVVAYSDVTLTPSGVISDNISMTCSGVNTRIINFLM